MILIAYAGSSKTKWCFCDEAGYELNIETSGINPHHIDNNSIIDIISLELFTEIDNSLLDIEALYYYGSGISSQTIKDNIKSLLTSIFKIPNVFVYSDLLGTCRGLFGKEKGIAAILGTGSNSCLYDGENIIANISPLGYILGDEGSGTHLGKTLVADILKERRSERLKKMFFDEFNTNKDEIIENVYRKVHANRYLASFAFFLSKHKDEKECRDIVYKCFCDFFERNILSYESANIYKINFTGSIAENFKDILFEVCNKYDIKPGKIETNPITGLIKYHLNK